LAIWHDTVGGFRLSVGGLALDSGDMLSVRLKEVFFGEGVRALETRLSIARAKAVERAKAVAFLRELRAKARKDTLTRIALNGYAGSIANILGLPVEDVSVYPFRSRMGI
jgi:hypothetical protein